MRGLGLRGLVPAGVLYKGLAVGLSSPMEGTGKLRVVLTGKPAELLGVEGMERLEEVSLSVDDDDSVRGIGIVLPLSPFIENASLNFVPASIWTDSACNCCFTLRWTELARNMFSAEFDSELLRKRSLNDMPLEVDGELSPVRPRTT